MCAARVNVATACVAVAGELGGVDPLIVDSIGGVVVDGDVYDDNIAIHFGSFALCVDKDESMLGFDIHIFLAHGLN